MKRRRSSGGSTAEGADVESDGNGTAVAKAKTAKKKAATAKEKKDKGNSGKDNNKDQKTKKAAPKKPPTKRRKTSAATSRKKKKNEEAEAADAGPLVEWEKLTWSYNNHLPIPRLIAHCRAADKKNEGYVSLQQFKRILSATLPMADFSGKNEINNIVKPAESLVRKGFVPYALFEADTSSGMDSYMPSTKADDAIDTFLRNLKVNPKAITAESIVKITEDETKMEKLKTKHPLHLLAKHFSEEVGNALLSSGIDVDSKNYSSETPFMLACKKQNLAAAKFFLDNGADINAASTPGMTALYEACSTGDLNTVQFLLDYRKPDSKSDKPLVDVNTRTNIGGYDYSNTYRFGGESPLIIALKRCSRMHAGQLNHLRAEAQKKKQDKMETESKEEEDGYLAGDRERIVALLLPHIEDINQTNGAMESPISLAVELANPYLVRKILEAFPAKVKTNIDVSLTNKTPLMHAAVALNVCASKIVKLLVGVKGIDVNVGPSGRTALFLACKENKTKAALALLNAGADPSLAKNSHHPLHFAAQFHNTYLAQKLLEAGTDINAVDKDGRNVLHLVFVGSGPNLASADQVAEETLPVHLRSSRKNCLKLFSASGAKIDHCDVLGNSPVAYALVYNHFESVPFLFDLANPKNSNLFDRVSYNLIRPVKPECQDSDYQEGIHDCEEKREAIDDMSAEEKANVQAVNRWKKDMATFLRRNRSFSAFKGNVGQSALHFFARNGKLELIRDTISRFNDPREINTVVPETGNTALLLACQRQDTRMMELLLKNGADVNIANKCKESPLHAVLQRSSVGDPIASVSLLCDVEGVLVDNPDSSGNTPLALAAKNGSVMSSLCLLNHGANIDAANTLGNTPLVQALLESHVTYAALLMQKGACLNTKVVTTQNRSEWNAAKRRMQYKQEEIVSTLFDYAAERNYEGLCFLMLDIGIEGSQLFKALEHLLTTFKYTLAQVLIKKYSASEERRTELRNLDIYALVGLISGLKVANEDERFKEWWQELIDRLLEIAPAKASLVSDPASNLKLPTLLAAEANHPQILRYLLKQGLDVTVSGKDGETILHIAARKNYLPVITAVIGDSVATADKAKDKMELEDDDEEKAKEVELNAKNRKSLSSVINAKNIAQQTALIRATHTHSFASYRNHRLLSKLLEIEGVDVNAQDCKKNTALFYAVKTSADQCVDVLLKHGASPTIVCENGETAIFEAARKNSFNIMRALLATGKVDPHVANAKGERLLALCQPLSAVALYQYVTSKSSSSSSSAFKSLFPEFEPGKDEKAEDLTPQLVAFLESINEGLQLYPDHQEPLEQLRLLVTKHLTESKQSNLVPRDILQNSRQLSFSSLSQEELAELQKKRKSKEDEEEAEDDTASSNTKKAKTKDGDENESESNGEEEDEEEEEEEIEEPDIEIGDDIEQIPFPPPKKWTIKHAHKFVDQEFKNRNRLEASRAYLLWGKNEEADDDDEAESKMDEDSEEGYLYDAKLNLCDISYGTYGHNKYYIIQALGNRARPDRFYLWTRWARVGSYTFDSQCQEFTTKAEAVKAFKQKFRDKTKNHWDERANFKQAYDRYYYIPSTYDEEDEAKEEDSSQDDEKGIDESCKLPARVQSLLRLISNRKEFMYTYSAYGLRSAGLGSLSGGQIRNGFKILKMITGVLTYMEKKTKKGEQVPQKYRNALVELSNKYYSILPYNFGRKLPDVISNTGQVAEQMRILESLADIDLGVQILSEAEKEGLSGGHVLEKLYNALHTDLKPIDKSADEWQVINEFMATSGLTVMDAFAIEREGEAMRFRPFSHLPNRTLLAHGTRLANAMGILRKGLRIAPPEAPHCGYMFGKGIYFADVAEKSANYCCLGTGEVGVFFLCEVALGNPYKCYQANYIEMLPKGKHSTMGCGRVIPSADASIYTDEGVKIPLGRSTPSEEERNKCHLNYNEHIVYNEGQVHIRYILKVRRS